MKTKWFALLLTFLLLMPFASCVAANTPIHTEVITPVYTGVAMMTPTSTIESTMQVTNTLTSGSLSVREPTTVPETPQPLLGTIQAENGNHTEGDAMKTILITVGRSTFPAKLYDNETTRALLAQLPLNLTTSELNGREKFYHLPEKLPADRTETPATIQAGEIMLWSSDNLVLFYNTFANSYGGYVKLDNVEDVIGLADALGSGSVAVTFEISH